EQYRNGTEVGPWTDVYAVGASMRACIEGRSPPPSIERATEDKMVPARQAFAGRYPPHLLAAIDWAMAVNPAQRPRSAAELREALLQQRPVPPPFGDADPSTAD
ncbi:MAG: hypothetical protein RLZ44_1546, partial [Pseudomonadota bacterium]